MSTLTNDPVREPFIFEAGSYSPRNILFPIKASCHRVFERLLDV